MENRKGFLALLLALLTGACAQPYPPMTHQAQPQWQQVYQQQHGLVYVCEPSRGIGTGQVLGTLGGAAAGGYIGSEAIGSKAGTAGLAVLGAIIGNQAGAAMDQQQNCYYTQGPQPYASTPYYLREPQGFGPGGRVCREFVEDVTMVRTNTITQAHYIACQDSQGFWRIMQ